MKTLELKKLRDFLRTKVDPDHFDMWVWATDFELKQKGETNSCNTAACGLGYATLLFDELELQGDIQGEVMIAYRVRIPRGTIHYGYGAAAAFFDITVEQARAVFDPEGYQMRWEGRITPAEVADRIDELLAGTLEEGDRHADQRADH